MAQLPAQGRRIALCLGAAGRRAFVSTSLARGSGSWEAVETKKHDRVFRHNVATGEWVVYAANRRSRPKQTKHEVVRQYARDFEKVVSDCPFCVGNEEQTPPEIMRIAPPAPFSGTGEQSSTWELRVIPNKFPAVSPVVGEDHHTQDVFDHVAFRDSITDNNEIPAVGHHEVIIESPDHNHLAATGTPQQVERLLLAMRARGQAMAVSPSTRHVLFFKNQGGTAGASLIHPHSQVVGLPIIPGQVQLKLGLAHSFYQQHAVSVYAKMLEDELATGTRILDKNEHAVAFVPYAAICPFEAWVLPRRHQAHFTDTTDEEIKALASILHRHLSRLHKSLDEAPFNLVVRSAPIPDRVRACAYHYSAFYSWHVCIFPRLGAGAMAGFEFGSGIFSNGNMPEDDAKLLIAADAA